MKLKHILIPYVILIVIIPAIITHLFVPLKINQKVWETGIDIVMAIVSFGGLITVIIRRKRKFRGWILLLLLIVLIIGPQMYLWKTQNRGFTELRIIYRFALLYISLFVIPLEIHFSRKEQLIIIFGFCLFGLFCCSYELIQHPRVWESMEFFSGKTSAVTSFFNHRNRFAAYNALWLILCLFAIQLSGSPLWLIPGSVFGIFVILTESRGAMLLSVVFIFLCFLSYHHRIGTKNTLIILLDISIVIIILWLIPPVRRFLTAFIDTDRGVTGRDKLWQTAWNYYLEANPLFGHGLGTPIEKIMIERVGANFNTHSAYLYILNCGGICMFVLYIASAAFLMQYHCRKRHYLIPLLIAVLTYGLFELACTPFDFWHLSNLFTICMFFLPAAGAFPKSGNRIPIH